MKLFANKFDCVENCQSGDAVCRYAQLSLLAMGWGCNEDRFKEIRNSI
ncbi:hypothetical protein [Metapseudomonas sp. CR1201]